MMQTDAWRRRLRGQALEEPLLKGKVVVITGAAGGIGRAIALAFARRGAVLELCDLAPERLRAVAEAARSAGAEEVTEHVVDVGDADAVTALAASVHERCAAIDVLVSAAGVLVSGGFLQTELRDWTWLLNANLLGVVHCARVFLPAMVARGAGGQLIHVASASGFFNLQKLAAYGTTKYAVLGLSEALRAELAPHRIGVTAVCPAFVDSGLVERVRLRGAEAPAEELERLRALSKRRGIQPEVVAEAVLSALRDNPALLPVGRDAWALYLVKRFLPQSTWDIVRALATRRR